MSSRRRTVGQYVVKESAGISQDQDAVDFDAGGKTVRLTNLRKVFWPDLGMTKADLLQFYIDVAPVLLPHLADRAMVMKRYPNGIGGDFFFMKRAPTPRPGWIETCPIEHGSGSVIDFPVIGDLGSLLWVVNLGCIDLNPWYARCDDVDRPDYLHFDLDPVKGASWPQMLETATVVHEALTQLKLPTFIKTTGSRGFHIYVPIVRGPTQKEVWTFAKQLATSLAALRPDLMTAEYRIAKRPSRVYLLGQASTQSHGFYADHLERTGTRSSDRRLPDGQCSPAHQEARRSLGAFAGTKRPSKISIILWRY